MMGTPTGHEKSRRPVYIRDEIISDGVACNVYHVPYGPETWTVDEPKTKMVVSVCTSPAGGTNIARERRIANMGALT